MSGLFCVFSPEAPTNGCSRQLFTHRQACEG